MKIGPALRTSSHGRRAASPNKASIQHDWGAHWVAIEPSGIFDDLTIGPREATLRSEGFSRMRLRSGSV
jgi:hypothetical protein